MPKIICTKEDWLKVGLSFFSEGGPAALNIEKMALILGCAKTSFYNYFQNRINFQESIIDYWVEYTTIRFKKEVQNFEDPIIQMKFLISKLFSDREIKNFYFYFRQLARTDKKYGKVLEDNETQRINSIYAIIKKINPNGEFTMEKSELLYDYFFGWYDRHQHLPSSTALIKKQLKMVSLLLGVDLTK